MKQWSNASECADGKANSVGPDQTGSTLIAQTYLSQYLEILRYTVTVNETRPLI